MTSPSDVFYFYRQTALRRDLVQGKETDPGARHLLGGLDYFQQQGLVTLHNLSLSATTDTPQGRLAHWLAFLINRCGGLTGDFQTVFSNRKAANRSRVILSSVDTVGIPLALLKWLGLITRPLIYTSIGLPERIMRLRSESRRRFYRAHYRQVSRFVTYGWEEARWIRHWLELPPDSPRVAFIPFGVDERYFTPRPSRLPLKDVLSIGADPQRDFATVLTMATQHPGISFRLIVGTDRAKDLGSIPHNVEVLVNVPFPQIRDHLASARVVALPVHDNSYSAGTTTLLQAMAMARPVVVSQTGAIRDGYHLANGQNCRLITPGDRSAFASALLDVLADPPSAEHMGHAARRTIEDHLTWSRLEQRLLSVVKEVMT